MHAVAFLLGIIIAIKIWYLKNLIYWQCKIKLLVLYYSLILDRNLAVILEGCKPIREQ